MMYTTHTSADNACPICGERRNMLRTFSRYNDEIIRYIKLHNIVKMDSCIACVKKHISRAMIYYEELLSAENSGKADGTASVNVPMNHLKIIGHLGCAVEESGEFVELHEAIKHYEREYRYYGVSPDWTAISSLITKYEQTYGK